MITAIFGAFGQITQPDTLANLGSSADTGIGNLLNAVFNILIIIGGIWSVLNIIIAGYGFMSAGNDPQKIAAAWAKVWQTLLGLVLVAGAFLLAAIISQVLFGDPSVILSPSFST